MKTIQLTKGAMTLVDDGDYEMLMQNSWYLTAQGYAARSSSLRRVRFCLQMHRAITSAPRHFHVDHINCDKLDNRRANLRICTAAQNQGNRRHTRGRRFKGVMFRAGKNYGAKRYVAEIYSGGRSTYLGIFHTEIEAALAYDAAARITYGEFARLNFPVQDQERAVIERAVA